MDRKEITREGSALKVKLDGLESVTIGQTLDMVGEQIVGMVHGVATDTGIFKETVLIDHFGGGCNPETVSKLTGSYGGVPYNLQVKSDYGSVTVSVEREDGQKIPEVLEAELDTTITVYLEKQDSGE